MRKQTLISVILFAVMWALLHFVFHIRFAGLQKLWLLAIYFAIHFVADWFLKKDIKRQKEDDKFKDWATSGPIGKYGQNGLLFMFYTTGLLTFLNPFQLYQIIKQAIGNFKLKSDKKSLIDNADEYINEVDYILPFEKDVEWLVYNGGITRQSSHSWDVITQRYAYDFVIADEKYSRHNNKGTDVEDYFCYNQNIVGVADGTVIEAVNNMRNAPFVGYGILDFLTTSFIGNYIIIKHTENEYSFYAHLTKGSVAVKKGDIIKQGQIIGKCGHSGYSSEPHLHFHLQDSADFYTAKGLPVRFSNIFIDKNKSEEDVFITAGNRVSQ